MIATPGKQVLTVVSAECVSRFIKHKNYISDINMGVPPRGGHCIGDCTPTRDRGQSEVKRSRRNFEAGQAVKLGIGGSLRTVKVSPGDRWAWLMLDSQGSRPDFRCGQRVKHENLLGQDLDRGRGWNTVAYAVSPPCPPIPRNQLPIDQLPVKINCCQVGGYKNRRISWVSYMF